MVPGVIALGYGDELRGVMMKKLFEENRDVLKGFVGQVPRFKVPGRSEFKEERDSILLNVMDSMVVQPETWDELCQTSIGMIGYEFISRLSGTYQGLSDDELEIIASLCFRFLLERDLSTRENLGPELEYSKNFAIERADEFKPDAKRQIRYVCHAMPITICKSVLNSDEIGGIKSLQSSLKKAEDLKTKWDQELSAKTKEVARLKEALDRYETAFNFVGLYDGFDGLAKEKIKEKESIAYWLRRLGILAVIPIIVELAYIAYVIFSETGMPSVTQMSLSVLPVISLVALLVYYFRVLLFNYRAVNSQLMQIELRKALCQFVQSYADYASEIKAKTPMVLDRFEKIVFSEIMADEENLPSLHDGVEQIASAIKSLKKS